METAAAGMPTDARAAVTASAILGGQVALPLEGRHYQETYAQKSDTSGTIITSTSPGGNGYYAIVIEQKSGRAWLARHGLNGSQYQAVFDTYVPLGYRPTIISSHTNAGQQRYVIVMEQKGGGAWVARHGLSSALYQRHYDDLVPRGYRPVIISASPAN